LSITGIGSRAGELHRQPKRSIIAPENAAWGAVLGTITTTMLLVAFAAVSILAALAMVAYRIRTTAAIFAVSFIELLALAITYYGGVFGAPLALRLFFGGVFLSLLTAAVLLTYLVDGIQAARYLVITILTAFVAFTLTWLLGLSFAPTLGFFPAEAITIPEAWLAAVLVTIAEAAGLLAVVPLYVTLGRHLHLPNWSRIAGALTITPVLNGLVILLGTLMFGGASAFYGVFGTTLAARIVVGAWVTPGMLIFLRVVQASDRLPIATGALATLAQLTEVRRNLAEVEARYQAVFQAAPDAIFLCDRQGIVRQASTHAEQDSGYRPGALAGVPLWRIVSTEREEARAEAALKAYLKQSRADQVIRFEALMQRADRSTIPVDVSLARIGGAAPTFLAIAHDLTRQKRDESQMRNQISELNTLADVSRISASETDMEKLLKASADRVGGLVGADGCYITLWDQGQLTFAAASGPVVEHEKFKSLPPLAENEGPSISLAALSRGHPLVIEDLPKSPYFNPRLHAEFAIRSAVALPLVAARHKVGTLVVTHSQKRPFSPEDINTLERAANVLALAIARMRLLEQVHERLLHVLVLNRVSEDLASVLDARRVLQTLSGEIVEAFRVQSCAALERDEDSDGMSLIIGGLSPQTGEADTFCDEILAFPWAEQFESSGTLVPIEDVRTDARLAPVLGLLESAGIRSLLLAPLAVRGQILGLMLLNTTERGPLLPSELDLLQSMVRYGAVALERANLFAETVEAQRMSESLRQVAVALVSTLDYEEILERILLGLSQLVPCDAANIQVVQDGMLRVILSRGYEKIAPDVNLNDIRLPLEQCAINMDMARTRKPAFVADVRAEPRWYVPEGASARWLRSWAAAPIVVRDEVVGFLNVDSTVPGIYTERHAEVLEQFANQAAVALENARLYAEAQEQRVIAETLRDAGMVLSSSLDTDEILDRILVLLERLVPYDAANIQLLQEGRVTLSRLRGYEKFQARKAAESAFFMVEDVPNLRTMIESQKQWYIPDTWDDPNWLKVEGLEWLRSWAAAPIVVRGEVIGFINVDSATPGTYAAHHAELLAMFASQSAMAMENALLYEQAQRRLRELGMLYEIGQRLQRLHTPESLAQEIVDALAEILGFDHGSVLLIDESTGELSNFALSEKGQDADFIKAEEARIRAYNLRLGRGITGWVAQHGESVRTANAPDDPRYLPVREDIVSELCVPLRIGDKVIGVINVESIVANAYTEGDQRMLETVASQIAIAIQNARLYDDLQSAYEQLKVTQEEAMRTERLQALGQMASGIAHDFNNVLTPILGYLELVLENPVLPEDVRSDVERARRAALAAGAIVARLREFYRPRDTSEPFGPADLSTVVADAVDLTRPRWRDIPQEHGAVIHIETRLSDLPPVHGDVSALRDLLTNLILNAVDAMPTGGTLTIRTERRANHALLTVSDTGVGMSEDVKRRLFEPFFSTKGTQGTGLGLAVCYGIVQRHSGSIDVESKLGQGTTFLVRLPLSEEALSLETDGGVPKVPPQTILLVDDEEIVLRVVSRMLSRGGHSVITALGGQEAIDRFQPEAVDLVITDLGMPQVTGREVARAIKTRSPETPVILLTGWGSKVEAEQRAPEEVDAVINKPVKFSELHRVLARVLEGRRRPGR